MDSNMKIDLDKLPIKRIEAIEESGVEHFPSEISNEETRLNAIRRVDFSSIIERDSKKAKSSKESPAAAAAAAATWPWQSLVENLRQAHQELNVVIDLINTVEANDAVTVAWMQRPKQLPNEVLSDLSVSAATKLQWLRATPAANSLSEEDIKALTRRTQDGGTEVVEAKAGKGSATLSMAYAGALFADACLKGLNGVPDVVECSFVQSSTTELPFFSSKVRLGKNGVEEVLGLGSLSDFEKQGLENLKAELKSSIEKGIKFANEN